MVGQDDILLEKIDNFLEKIIESARDYRSLSYLADSLGVSYQLLIYWLEKVYKIKKEDFFRKYVCKKGCKLLEINGVYRYVISNKLVGYCRCKVGINKLVVNIDDDDLFKVFGGKVSKIENDTYTIDF